ncbi:MAG: T9SS type A sorting domain-containing protein, partial [Saprospiraceae bacterium]|nr:T9SS type A sorting domain-containing protein [Saprospiraceae bacterium]
DSCWYEVVVSQCAEFGSTYLEGLGGPYYQRTCPPQIVDTRELRYFRKGNEEWGEPFDFTVSVHDALSDGTLQIYPNPALDQVTISTSDQMRRSHLRISDMSGRVVLTQAFAGSATIDITHFSPGLYTVQVVDNRTHSTGRLVVAR